MKREQRLTARKPRTSPNTAASRPNNSDKLVTVLLPRVSAAHLYGETYANRDEVLAAYSVRSLTIAPAVTLPGLEGLEGM